MWPRKKRQDENKPIIAEEEEKTAVEPEALPVHIEDYVKPEDFDERRFWHKIGTYAKKAGYGAIEKALWLYYAAQKPDTPLWAKAAIYGALAYFVLPLDAIPDLVPIVGYSDDLAALAAAIASVSKQIDDDVKEKASEKLTEWFDEPASTNRSDS